MKILAVDQDCLLSPDRGLYRAIDSVEQGWLTLLVPSIWKDMGRVLLAEEERGPLRVMKSEVFFPGKSHRAMYRSLPRILRDLKPSVLFVNAEPESYLAWQSATAIRRHSRSTKLVFMTWRNIDYSRIGFPYKLAGLNARAERKVLGMASLCIARTPQAAELLRTIGFHHTTVIPPCVDTSIFVPKPADAAGPTPAKPPVIGFVGRLIALKGVDLLLRAAAVLNRSLRILLVGEGPERHRLIALAHELRLANSVEWAGAVPHSALPAYLRRMDVLVLPSVSGKTWKEQFGRVLIEAMASGVPVVGSTSGEIPQVIGGAGMVFPEGDVDMLARRLRELLEDQSLRDTFREEGIVRVHRHFEVPLVAAQYVQLFRQLSGLP